MRISQTVEGNRIVTRRKDGSVTYKMLGYDYDSDAGNRRIKEMQDAGEVDLDEEDLDEEDLQEVADRFYWNERDRELFVENGWSRRERERGTSRSTGWGRMPSGTGTPSSGRMGWGLTTPARQAEDDQAVLDSHGEEGLGGEAGQDPDDPSFREGQTFDAIAREHGYDVRIPTEAELQAFQADLEVWPETSILPKRPFSQRRLSMFCWFSETFIICQHAV